MYSQSDFEAIKNIIISKVPQAVGIYLFGSYATGAAREDSDIDIMILLEKDLEWQERHKVLNWIYRATVEKGYLVDFLLKTREAFESDRELPTISRVIAREGKLLWTRS